MNKDFEDELGCLAPTWVKDISLTISSFFTFNAREFAKVFEIINAIIITAIYQTDFCCLQENKHCPMLPPADGIHNYKAPEVRLVL